ncbi:MAG: GNAT family N-acetyltransferase [bacterium]|nr:GNAT family N-acetyltransferase [bacterium]
MPLEYRFLSEDMMPEIFRTFMEAFSDYALDMSYMTEQSMYNRFVKNGTDFESSVGVFNGTKMAGFTMIGIDNWKNSLSAFDVGTGIVKEYRGKGIARKMFDHAVPLLKEKGVNEFYLEVLQENEPAIKAYEKTGFRIVREFDCYKLVLGSPDLEIVQSPLIEITEFDKNEITHFNDFLDWEPSWENSLNAITRIRDEIYLFKAVYEGSDAGILAYYPGLNWIMTLVVGRQFRRKGIASSLLKHLLCNDIIKEPEVKLINVESTDLGMKQFLSNKSFEIYVKQYEMELTIM